MDRRKEIFEFIKQDFEEKIKEKGLKISIHIENNEEEIKNTFLEKVDKLFKKAIEENKEIQYFLISPLRSSIFTKSYEVTLSIYTEEFYLQKEKYMEYFKIPYIFENIDVEMEQFNIKIKNNFKNILKFELEEIKQKYIEEHKMIVMLIAVHFLKYIYELESFKNLKKKDLSFLYGEYMDRVIKLFTYEEGE